MTKPFLFFFFFPKRLLREKREISFHGRIRALIAKLFLSLQNDPIFNVLTDMYRREADDYHHRYRYLLFFIFFFFFNPGIAFMPYASVVCNYIFRHWRHESKSPKTLTGSAPSVLYLGESF